MDIEATTQFAGKKLSYLFDCRGEDTIFPLKILSSLGSCQYKLRQIASQSFSEDNEANNGLSVNIWHDFESSIEEKNITVLEQ